jgi:hypothetical protein
MKQESGDLWTWNREGRWVVITTNIGWKKDGTNPMGAGVARAAVERYPDLALWYGKRCQKYRTKTAVAAYEEGKLFLFPTKPLDEERPWMSWQQDSSLELIERSCKQLIKLVDVLTKRGKFITRIGLPLPGCGNGNLTPRRVLPIVSNILDDRFVLLGHY